MTSIISRQLFSRTLQVLAGRGPIAPAFRSNAVNFMNKNSAVPKSCVGSLSCVWTPTLLAQSRISFPYAQSVFRCSPVRQGPAPRLFSNQAPVLNRRSSAPAPTSNDQPVMQAELVPIVNQIKLEMVSYARELNDIKKNCFGRVRNWEPYFNEGMFRLILLIPKLRALENASKRVQDALEEWTISDFHEYARRTSNVINPKTMCATNRELGALEKVFRDSDILPALAKIRIVEREIRRLAFNKCCELPYLAGHTESIRELALKTLGDSTGTRWDEDAALQLLKVLRQLEALSRA